MQDEAKETALETRHQTDDDISRRKEDQEKEARRFEWEGRPRKTWGRRPPNPINWETLFSKEKKGSKKRGEIEYKGGKDKNAKAEKEKRVTLKKRERCAPKFPFLLREKRGEKNGEANL